MKKQPKPDVEMQLFLLGIADYQPQKTKRKAKRIVKGNTRGRFPNYDREGTYHSIYKCPNCGCNIHLDWHERRNYCPECGIKLDWTEVNKPKGERP